ncbi:hypothetical protein HN924_01270 [Candidatus Woesearchaeota archaeon]|jgi:hypothetical protein|nr:hypothetical protein [Candidatus Woesearchaeota archaeon]MBT7062578.1 hypothetical protein [Candidatus Woesearchaeota archaeon]MBT7402371.1 hypothetical protein [Candidatus Woesearchaeota archaeon]
MSVHTNIVIKVKNDKQAKAIRKAIERSPLGQCWEKEYKYENNTLTFEAKINDEALKKQKSFLGFKWKERRIDSDIIEEISRDFPEITFELPYEDLAPTKIRNGQMLKQ